MSNEFYREDELIDIENQEAKKNDKKNKKAKKTGKLSIAIIAGLVALIFSVVAYWALLSAEDKALNKYDRTTVYVLTTDVAAGTQLTDASLFATKNIDSSVVPANAITDISSIKDTYILYDVSANSIVTDNMFYSINESENGTKEIGIALSSLTSGVNGIIRESDFVDLYINFGTSNSTTLDSDTTTTVVSSDGSVAYLSEGENISAATSMEAGVSVSPTYKNIYVSKAFTADGVRISNSDTTSITNRINIVVSEADADYIIGSILNGATISAAICTD